MPLIIILLTVAAPMWDDDIPVDIIAYIEQESHRNFILSLSFGCRCDNMALKPDKSTSCRTAGDPGE
jgi:hypothetical protein